MPALQLVIELDDKGSIKRVENLDRGFSHLTKSVQSGSARIAAGWQRVHGSMSGIAARLSRISLVAKIALAGFATAAIVTGAKFEQSMANVASVAGASDKELLALASTARYWGKQTAFSANEAADAMYSLASAGMNNIQIQNAVGGVLKFAGATATGLGEAAEQTVQALKMFEFEASQTDRVINVFSAGISASSLTAERLANSLGYVGGTAKAVGMSIEETVGTLANLHDAGLLGMRAGTGLKNVLAILAERGSKLRKVLGDMSLETNSLAEIMGYLGQKITDPAQIFSIFGRETAPAVLAMMTAGTEGMNSMTAAVMGTSKAAEMYEKQMATVQNQLKIFKSAMQENMIAMFMALKPLIDTAVKSMIGWASTIKPYIVGAAKALTDYVRVNEDFIQKAAVMIGKIMLGIAAFAIFSQVVQALSASFIVLSGIIVITQGLFGLLSVVGAGALFNIQMAMELFKAIMVRNWAIVHAASIGPWGILIAVAGAVLAALVVIIVKNRDHICAAFKKVGEFFVMVWTNIKDFFAHIVGWIGDKAAWLGNKIQEAFRKPFDWVWEKLQWLAEKAGWMMDQIVPGFTDKMNEIRGVVVDKMTDAAGAVEKGVGAAIDATGRAAVAAGGALGDAAQATGHGFAVAFDYVKDKAGDMVDTVKGKIPDLRAMIAGALGDLKALGAGLEMSMPATAATGAAKPPPELDFSAQMLADHAARLQKESEMDLAAWQGGVKARLDLQKAAALEAVAYEAASTSNWLAAKQTLAAMEMSERINKENATAAQIAEARIAYDAAVQDAEMAHNEAVWEAWLARNVEMQALIAGLSSAYDTMVDSALDKEMGGKKRREAIWKSMSTSFLRTTGDMLKKSFAMHIRNMVVTSATEETLNVKRKFTEAKIGAVKAYQAFASIPIIGPALGAAAAAAAFTFLMTFHRGGFVEPDSVTTVKRTAYDERIVKLQTEEFVMQRSAVRGIGRADMEYMNATGRLPVRSIESAPGRAAPSTGKGGGDTIGPFVFHISGSREDAENIADAIEEKIIPMLENAIGRRKFSLEGAM